MTRYAILDTPAGPLTVAGRDGWVETLRFGAEAGKGWEPGAFPDAARQLELYFQAKLKEFDLALRPEGTEFQQQVWTELRCIPYGATVTYGELARRIGHPAAVRAVGLANGANPIAIVIPCHRVVGAGGKLTGYAGGLDVKRRLLALERGEKLL
ncbi:MAG: methylated-DNA--[protein]-cysteine S-methyltransferase [Bryobacteraceae bacterium]|nr:methylated-DNA--[protein]-cysteine S-methyltransferase [Bryobacteraceae bacterium]